MMLAGVGGLSLHPSSWSTSDSIFWTHTRSNATSTWRWMAAASGRGSVGSQGSWNFTARVMHALATRW